MSTSFEAEPPSAGPARTGALGAPALPPSPPGAADRGPTAEAASYAAQPAPAASAAAREPARGSAPQPSPPARPAPPASPFGPAVFRWVWIIGLVLMAIDIAALTILLYRLGLPVGWALGLAALSGGFGTYQAQFAHLLSRDAFLVHRSPWRHLAMAIAVLASNIGSLQLVADQRYGAYALARLALAFVVVWAWGQRVGPKLLGDGLAALDRRVFEERVVRPPRAPGAEPAREAAPPRGDAPPSPG